MVPKEDFEVLAEQVQVYGERVAELEKLLEAVQTIKDAESVLAAS
jgi:thiamine pyrophosphate-dependent acetolactate synthase large subunit-like protein